MMFRSWVKTPRSLGTGSELLTLQEGLVLSRARISVPLFPSQIMTNKAKVLSICLQDELCKLLTVAIVGNWPGWQKPLKCPAQQAACAPRRNQEKSLPLDWQALSFSISNPDRALQDLSLGSESQPGLPQSRAEQGQRYNKCPCPPGSQEGNVHLCGPDQSGLCN